MCGKTVEGFSLKNEARKAFPATKNELLESITSTFYFGILGFLREENTFDLDDCFCFSHLLHVLHSVVNFCCYLVRCSCCKSSLHYFVCVSFRLTKKEACERSANEPRIRIGSPRFFSPVSESHTPFVDMQWVNTIHINRIMDSWSYKSHLNIFLVLFKVRAPL